MEEKVTTVELNGWQFFIIMLALWIITVGMMKIYGSIERASARLDEISHSVAKEKP